MKSILLTLISICTASTLLAQSPESMSYQAVVRNASDALITNNPVGVQISILQSSPTGIAVYIERHTPTSNANGLVTFQIGNGTIVAGSFPGIDWSNGPYYLKTETDPTGGTSYTISATSQFLSVPYALHAGSVDNIDDADADPSNEIQTLSINGQDLSISGSGGNTITLPGGGNTLDEAYDQGGAGMGRIITADAGEVEITHSGSNTIGLRASTLNTGAGIIATSTNAANTFSPIQATTNSSSNTTSAIIGSSSGAAYGISGQAEASSTSTAGVYGNNLRTVGGHGVLGIGVNGVVGESNYQAGFGVYGRNYDAITPTGNGVGTYGLGYVGVWGDVNGVNAYAVYGNGDLGAAGLKTFSIDHPNDPENKYLRHFSIESDEVLNVYRGNASFDENGEAIVSMPEYFNAVSNENCTYQLTPIGGYAPLYIKEKMSDGQFVIAGGSEGMEVSWIVHTERDDPYTQQFPERRQVEVEKESWNKGKYLRPDLYGQPEDKKIVRPIDSNPTQEPLNKLEKE